MVEGWIRGVDGGEARCNGGVAYFENLRGMEEMKFDSGESAEQEELL